MGFYSLDASIWKILCVPSLSTKVTRSTHQWSPIRHQESFWNRPDFSYAVSILSQWFSNTDPTHWTLARRVVSYPKNTRDSVLFLSSEQGRPDNNSPMLKSYRKLRTAYLYWQWFCFLWRKRKNKSGACLLFCNLLIYWKSEKLESRLKKDHRSWVLRFEWENHSSSIPSKFYPLCL
jgi:hypothetical protein